MTYTKYHNPWGAANLLSGAAFNHLETQWDEATDDADAHTHDTRYYTKTLADLTFFTTSFYTGFDADKLDGSHYSDLVASVMPIGAIMVWSGTDGTVPTGWHICDGGTYGGRVSPDLRDRFVVGAGSTYAVDATGGPASWNGTITPTGSVTIGDHILITAELPIHVHSWVEYYSPQGLKATYGDGQARATASRSSTIGEQSSGDGAHGHPGSTASFTAIDPRPKYYALYYIMKFQ